MKMNEKNVIERLKQIIRNKAAIKKISTAQTNTILALVDEIHRGATISDDFLIRVFENIGGE